VRQAVPLLTPLSRSSTMTSAVVLNAPIHRKRKRKAL
jgi:hypothetical protein